MEVFFFFGGIDTLKPSKSKKQKKLSKVVKKSCQNFDICQKDILTKSKKEDNSSDIKEATDDLKPTQKKILTFVKKNSNLSNQEIANKLSISRQTASYNILKLIEKDFLVKKNGKIFLTFVKKPSSTLYSDHQNQDLSNCHFLHKWRYTIPIKTHGKSILEGMSWDSIAHNLNNTDSYIKHVFYEPYKQFKDLYNLQTNFVYLTLYFHVNRKKKTVTSLMIEFNDYIFQGISSEKAIETSKMILNNYLTSLSQKHQIYFDLDKMKWSGGHIDVCDAPDVLDKITFQSDFARKDKSPPSKKNRIEATGKTEKDTIDHAQTIMDLPHILDETNNSMGALQVQFQGVNKKIDVVLDQLLKTTNNDGKLIQILGNLTSRIKEIGALLDANDKEQQLHHEVLKKRLKDDMDMYQ